MTYIPLQIDRKDEKNMSFVGLHIMNDGIIGFADSKATLTFTSGRKVEDVKRGRISKIFKNKNFILVTYGSNTLFMNEYEQNIEDYILHNITENTLYTDFIKNFKKDIYGKYNNREYHFIIGSKDKYNRYFIKEFNFPEITPNDAVYKGYLIGGDELYRKIYTSHCFYHDIDIYQYSKQIQKFIESIVKAEDVFSEYTYNSVGLPINIEIFQ